MKAVIFGLLSIFVLVSCDKGFKVKDDVMSNEPGVFQTAKTEDVGNSQTIKASEYCPPIKIKASILDTAIELNGGIAIFNSKDSVKCDQGSSVTNKESLFGSSRFSWIPPINLVEVNEFSSDEKNTQVELVFQEIESNEALVADISKKLEWNVKDFVPDRKLIQMLPFQFTKIQVPLNLSIVWHDKILNLVTYGYGDHQIGVKLNFDLISDKKDFLSDLSSTNSVEINKSLRLDNSVQYFNARIGKNSIGAWKASQEPNGSEVTKIKLLEFLSRTLGQNGYDIESIQKLYPNVIQQANQVWSDFPDSSKLDITTFYLLPIAASLNLPKAKSVYKIYSVLSSLVLNGQEVDYLTISIQAASGVLSDDEFNSILSRSLELRTVNNLRYEYTLTPYKYSYWNSVKQDLDLKKNYMDSSFVFDISKAILRNRIYMHVSGGADLQNEKIMIETIMKSKNPSFVIEKLNRVFGSIVPDNQLDIFISIQDLWQFFEKIVYSETISDDQIKVFASSYRWFLFTYLNSIDQPITLDQKVAFNKIIYYTYNFSSKEFQLLKQLFGKMKKEFADQGRDKDIDMSAIDSQLNAFEEFVKANPNISDVDLDLVVKKTAELAQKKMSVLVAFKKAGSDVLSKKGNLKKFRNQKH